MVATSATSLASRRARADRRRHVDDARREELVGWLEKLILSEGFRQLTMDELASRLQCSKSTLYAVAAGKNQAVLIALKHFFREAAARIEQRVATITDPAERIAIYLASVGEEMCKMSQQCHIDMVADDATFEIWALNARASAQRVREFIREGVESGQFRAVHAAFVGESVTLLVDGIQHGELLERTGLTSGEAYAELSEVVLAALTNTTR
ncbi:TetR/AcrR family transcriptional regulator [Amycolatopsis sp. NPDC003865]